MPGWAAAGRGDAGDLSAKGIGGAGGAAPVAAVAGEATGAGALVGARAILRVLVRVEPTAALRDECLRAVDRWWVLDGGRSIVVDVLVPASLAGGAG